MSLLAGLRRIRGAAEARQPRVAATIALLAALLTAGGPARAGDEPGTRHSYPIVRVGDPTLPDHTIIRPADPAAVDFRMPIVVWGNGGCRDSNEEFHYFLVHFAAFGYLVVANGPPQNPYHPEELAGLLGPQPHKLIAGMDWALKQNATPASPLYQRLDPSRIVVMGQSCGGWETSDASADPRVTTSIVWDSGFDPYNPADSMSSHAPVLYAYGGPTDYANWDALGAYGETSVPTVLAANDSAGHTGMWDDPTAPAQPPGPYQNEPLAIAPRWLGFTLYGRADDRAYFLGSPCGLCQRPGWSVQNKNWEAYKGPPAPATAPGTAPGHGTGPAPAPGKPRRRSGAPACRGGRVIGYAARAWLTSIDARPMAVLLCVRGIAARRATVTMMRAHRAVAVRRLALRPAGTRVLLEPGPGRRFTGGRYRVLIRAGRRRVAGWLTLAARNAA